MDEPTKRAEGEKAPERRVLVVDDSRDTTRMMKVLLKGEGFEVCTTHDGPEAIEAAKRHRPDVVLLDLALPSLGGVEVAEELRKTTELCDCLIIAVSGYAGDELPVPSPFDDHFMKPVNHDRLIKLLKGMAGEAGKPRAPTVCNGPATPAWA